MVLGGTGKTGRRVVARLVALGVSVRVGARGADIPFDWGDRSGWRAVLGGVEAVYLAYQPDLAMPGAPSDIKAFTAAARAAGVRRVVLLSGRGEPEARECEGIVLASRLEVTIVRSAFFAQNFSEGVFLASVLAGVVALPNGDVPEPFVDADDIAEVAVRALTEDGHVGRVYEVTGPRALSFAEAVGEIAAATGREIAFAELSRTEFIASLACSALPGEVVSLLDYLFGTLFDGRNSATADGVREALGRAPKDFAVYAREAAESGVWGGSARPKLVGASE
ncbi:NmrA family transcriptional regulator [Nocardia sp. NPDC050406]|uniref:NmrA family transcriptional regulator n=1 Tax=Nocardia sp. NPDC050406 TaxID=3364318 RepID=UPI00379F83DB